MFCQIHIPEGSDFLSVQSPRKPDSSVVSALASGARGPGSILVAGEEKNWMSEYAFLDIIYRNDINISGPSCGLGC